ncbi:hypothetical protein ACFFWB_13670 [Flavobacterium procerum]|uniref:hypothetical protein n=1 Tax=Flavobacterium procerum TaxID=1455569 RepID=UPI0035E9BF44
MPANPSVSFTLNNCKTITKLGFEKRANQNSFSFDLLFEGKPKEDFKPKIQKFLERVEVYLGVFFKGKNHLRFIRKKTFSHSSGKFLLRGSRKRGGLAMNFRILEKKKF